jgi:hypothetical protein
MANNSIFKITCLAFILILAFQSCKKQELTVPPAQAHFVNRTSGNYFVTGPAVSYTIPIGVTNVSSSDRTISINVTSPTGAQSGVHYTLDKTSVVIPAGKVLDSIKLQGVYAQYLNARKDSLIFTIKEEGGVAASSYNNTFKLFMRGPCAQVEIATDLQSMVGSYPNTIEYLGAGAPYGPYTTTISNAVLTSPTTANITVTNIFNDGWTPAVFTLDWSNPANSTLILNPSPQVVGGDAGNIFGPTYAGMPVALRTPSNGEVGTFSYCNKKLTLRVNPGISGVGFTTSILRVEMSK